MRATPPDEAEEEESVRSLRALVAEYGVGPPETNAAAWASLVNFLYFALRRE